MQPQEPQQQSIATSQSNNPVDTQVPIQPIANPERPKKKKRVLITSICGVALALTSFLIIGTIIITNPKNPEYIKKAALSYLKVKYNEDFTVESLSEPGFAYSDNILTVSTKEDPISYFKVRGSDPVKETTFRDGYYGVLIKNDYENFLKDKITGMGIIAKPFLILGEEVYSSKLNKEVPITKIYDTDKDTTFSIQIFTETESDAKKIEKELPQILVDNKLASDILVIALKRDKYNLLVSSSDINKIQFPNDVLYRSSIIKINSNLEIGY